MNCPTCKEDGLIDTAGDYWWCPFCGSLLGPDFSTPAQAGNEKTYVPTRSPYAQSLGVANLAAHFATGIHQGLLIVAADAVERANKLIADKAALPLAVEALAEAIAAVVHELDAQGEDIADIAVQIGDERLANADPERLRDLLRRTLRRRRAK